jgi:hypothetical protein
MVPLAGLIAGALKRTAMVSKRENENETIETQCAHFCQWFCQIFENVFV